LEVAKHKAFFFIENDKNGQRIDYHAAVSGSLTLVPTGKALEALNTDYDAMVNAGLLHSDDAYLFNKLMELCGDIAKRANGTS
jgi:hypothetical protein